MATVHIGRLRGAGGTARTVAIKRLHPSFAKDPEFAAMLLDEARMTMRIRHANVVPTIDVVADRDELFLVMEFVLGESLASVLKVLRVKGERMPMRVAAAVASDMLRALHAAHETTSEDGAPLGIVHRDVSPQNVIVGADGLTRVLDFGVAKAAGRTHTTREGEVKGKLPYMSQEQFLVADVDRRTDVFATAVVIWEALTGKALFARDAPGLTIQALLYDRIPAPSEEASEISAALDAVILRGLERNRELRYASAQEMAIALEAAIDPASPREVSEFLQATCGEALRARSEMIAAIEARAPLGEGAPPPSSSTGTPVVRDLDPDATRLDVAAATTNEAPPLEPSRARRRVPLPIALLIAALAIGIGFSLKIGLFSPSPVTALATSSAPLTPSPQAAQVSAPLATVTVAPAESVAPLVTATATATQTAAAPPHGQRPRATATAAAKPDCKNPFRIGADGLRVPRPECF